MVVELGHTSIMEEHKQSDSTVSLPQGATTIPTNIMTTTIPRQLHTTTPTTLTRLTHPPNQQSQIQMQQTVSAVGAIQYQQRDHAMNHIIPLGIINTTMPNKSPTNLRSGNVVPIPASSTTSTASARPPPSSTTTTTATAIPSRLPPSTIQFTTNSAMGNPITNGTLVANGTTGARSQLPRHTTTSITNASSSFLASSTTANVASSTASFVAAAAASTTRTSNHNGSPSIPSASRLSVSPPPSTDPDLLRIKSSLVQNDELYHKIRDGEEERRILAQRLHEVESLLRDSIERERLLEEERDVIGRNELKLNQETGQLKVKLDAAQTELNRLLNVIVPDMQAQLAAALKPAPPPVPSASPIAAASPSTAADAWLPSRHDFDRVLAARGLAEQKVALLQQQLEASGREKEEWKSRFSAMREKNRKTQELLATAHGLLNDDIKIQEKYAQDHALTLAQARRIKQLEKDLEERDETVEKLKEDLIKAQTAAQTPTPARVTRATTHIVSAAPTAAPKPRGRPKKNVGGAVVAVPAPTYLEQLLDEEKQSYEATNSERALDSSSNSTGIPTTAAVVRAVTPATALPKRRGRPPKRVQPPADDDQVHLGHSTIAVAASAASNGRPTKRAKHATARTDAERLELELFGDNSDHDMAADATSASSAAAASSSSSSSFISTYDQIRVLVESITAEWMDRNTFLQENTVVMDEHPIRLILPVLCGYSPSAEWDPRAAGDFKICVTQLPHFLLVLFRSLMIAIARATEGVQEERELVVLNAEASTLVESLGTQFPAIIEMLQTIVEQVSSTSGEQPMEIDADPGHTASSAQTAAGTSSSCIRTCSCRIGSPPIDLITSFTESIYSTFIQCKQPTPLSIEAATLECGYLTFLLESTNAADTQITLFIDLLCRLIYTRPILPLHLIEHGLNTWPAHMTPAFQPDHFVRLQCGHPRPRTSMESSIGEQLLPSPVICSDCIKSTSAISILSLAFHTILTQVLSPYPFEMLEMRLPHLNRFLSTKMVQPPPSMPAEAPSAISEQLLAFFLAALDAILLPSSSESNLVPAGSGEVNQLIQAFLLLLSSFGMEQSEFILNHIIRPKYNQSTEMIRTVPRATSVAEREEAADSMNDAAAAVNDQQDQRQLVHQLWKRIYLEATQLVLKQVL